MRINPLLKELNESFLYSLQLELTEDNLAKFADIKYVIMQGSSKRAAGLAKKLAQAISGIDTRFFEPVNLVSTSNFAVYRIGNILSVSHGMGNVTIDVLLHSITKLLHYAGNSDVEYIRVGTSGGIGVEPGSVIITQNSFMPNLEQYYTTYELDKRIDLPTHMDHKLVEKIMLAQPDNQQFQVIVANSIAADDFYLGQCRYDGAMIARKDTAWRETFFKQVREKGICNFEMESTALAAFCNQANISATMIAVTLLNRFNGDQITSTAEELAEFSDRSQTVVINYLLSQQ
jgi:uridine phosphorylase